MSTSDAPAPGVHRLLDMVVEEVSLVDSAANLHRFLVVKRDQPMPNPTEPAPAAGDTTRKADASLLSVATAALESITGLVEQLGELGDEDATSLVTELIEELTELATELGAAAGLEEEDASADTEKRATAGEAIADVRGMLAKIGVLLDAARKAGEATSSAPVVPPAPAAPPAPASPPTVAADAGLDAVTTSLRALTEAVKEQGQRLGRLEKGTGLPNSRSAAERPPPAADDDESWPLDLNKPLDRASVDKSVSFHDR